MRDLAKRNFLHDLSVEKGLDFIAILETHKRDFSDEILKSFCADREFSWHWIPPKGRSGGILIGVNQHTFLIENVNLGEFHIKLHVKNKCDGFRWVHVAVYGAAQPDRKELFLAKFVSTCSNETMPLMVGVILILSETQ